MWHQPGQMSEKVFLRAHAKAVGWKSQDEYGGDNDSRQEWVPGPVSLVARFSRFSFKSKRNN